MSRLTVAVNLAINNSEITHRLRNPFFFAYTTRKIVEISYDEKVNIGLKVNMHVSKEPKGDLLDVYATPAEEPKAPKRREAELKRLREDMDKTREWVKKTYGNK